jgi:two-component system chemotaxis response regulator CheY
VLSELPAAVVEEVTDGADALERFRDREFELVVCHWVDHALTLAFVQSIRREKQRASTPVLLLAEDVSLAQMAEVIAAGASGVLGKPFVAEPLRQKVTRLLKRP